MAPTLFATLVVVLHFGFVAFVLFGARLLRRRVWLAWLQLPSVAYATLVTIVGWPCPLTLVEQWLLARAGRPVYEGEFLDHYVWSVVGLNGTDFEVGASLVAVVLLLNAGPYYDLVRGRLTR